MKTRFHYILILIVMSPIVLQAQDEFTNELSENYPFVGEYVHKIYNFFKLTLVCFLFQVSDYLYVNR